MAALADGDYTGSACSMVPSLARFDAAPVGAVIYFQTKLGCVLDYCSLLVFSAWRSQKELNL
jgi:hypothetical protein